MKINLVVIMMILLSSCIKYSQPETYFIPNEFVGTVIVFYDYKNNEIEISRDSIKIHRISENGIHYSGFKRSKGILNQSFYYVDASNNIIDTLEYYDSYEPKHQKNNINYVYGMFDGKMTINAEVNEDRTSYNNLGSKKIDYIYFSIGKLDEISDKINESHIKIDEIIPKLSVVFRAGYPQVIRSFPNWLSVRLRLQID